MTVKIVLKDIISFDNKKIESLNFNRFKVGYIKDIPDEAYTLLGEETLSEKDKMKIANAMIPLIARLTETTEMAIKEMAIEDMMGIIDNFGGYFKKIFESK